MGRLTGQSRTCSQKGHPSTPCLLLHLTSEEVRYPAKTGPAKPKPWRQQGTYGLHHFEVQAGQGRQADHRLPPDPAVAVRLAGLRFFAVTRTRPRQVTTQRDAAVGLVTGLSWRCDGSRPHAEPGCPLLGVPPARHELPPGWLRVYGKDRTTPSPSQTTELNLQEPKNQEPDPLRNYKIPPRAQAYKWEELDKQQRSPPVQPAPRAALASQARWRIFRLSSASQPSGFDVWEDLPDDLAEIGGAQRAIAEVITVSPVGESCRLKPSSPSRCPPDAPR